MTNTATITVFLQALGGKFLGPNAYAPDRIRLSLVHRGETTRLPYQLHANSGDGSITSSFSAGSSSPLPILTPVPVIATPLVNYVTAELNTICAVAVVELNEECEAASLCAIIPRPWGPELRLEQALLLFATQTDYQITLVVPGLMVVGAPELDDGCLSATVKMMCGCPVTQNLSYSYWSPADFTVIARVNYRDRLPRAYPMNFDAKANQSTFSVRVDHPELVTDVSYSARQVSTGNYGYFQHTLGVP